MDGRSIEWMEKIYSRARKKSVKVLVGGICGQRSAIIAVF